MAQTGYTPISLYYSATAAATPTSGNLVAGELAINTADGKLFYKDSAGVVQVLATKGSAVVAGANGQVQYNNNGALGASANLAFDGTTLAANTLYSTAVTTANGGLICNQGLVVASANAPTGSTGPTLFGGYSSGGGTAFIQGYNITTAAYIPMSVYGSTLNFGTGSSVTTAMFIDSNQNVCVGGTTALVTSASRANITVNGASSSIVVLGTGGTKRGYIYSDSSHFELDATGYMQFNSGGAERMRLDASGQFMIGTTTPSSILTVNGTVTATTFAGNATSAQTLFGGSTIYISQLNANTLNSGYSANANADMWINYKGYADGDTQYRDFRVGNGRQGQIAVFTGSTGSVAFSGAVSKASGTFRIDHPLPQLNETHNLVHSFIEGPQADLIYRGVANLVNGKATINIDEAAGMTEGTFVLLCREVQCFTTNESDWSLVRGKVTGNILTIESQDTAATSSISWMVIGERQDKHMYETDWTDDEGKVILEPLKPPKPVMETFKEVK